MLGGICNSADPSYLQDVRLTRFRLLRVCVVHWHRSSRESWLQEAVGSPLPDTRRCLEKQSSRTYAIARQAVPRNIPDIAYTIPTPYSLSHESRITFASPTATTPLSHIHQRTSRIPMPSLHAPSLSNQPTADTRRRHARNTPRSPQPIQSPDCFR
ncbi:hypothetical protein EJ03DRAFT_325475 [Teratosphaeria nubilosa]|uniref:Uncharacterized protein n=1 Tax=Teratosphaeria nubilosa TaxID=161662 RepID=A0A6G1LEP7_9PEZI|nr:hypothetical protein EJ03DRAFT_325475 [Teratosphaeria nubilosa]